MRDGAVAVETQTANHHGSPPVELSRRLRAGLRAPVFPGSGPVPHNILSLRRQVAHVQTHGGKSNDGNLIVLG
ncbi:MAG: hypothetical protein ACREX8_04740, partial [Gammaproteobacteria bacterium]